MESVNFKELRVGNIVFNEYTKTIIKVYPMMINQLSKIESENNITSVPLTEDFLLKFGFKKDGDCYYKKFNKQGEFFVFSSNTTVGLANNIKSPFYFSYKYIIGLNYCHQLQNLYFALTQEELIFDL